MRHEHDTHCTASAHLTADWMIGVTRDDVTIAILGGGVEIVDPTDGTITWSQCPTEGIEAYTIQPLARLIRIYGTVDGVDAVWRFLADRGIVAPWPNFLDQVGVA